jgi:hypothetical protein
MHEIYTYILRDQYEAYSTLDPDPAWQRQVREHHVERLRHKARRLPVMSALEHAR